jgi:hypothetical protein
MGIWSRFEDVDVERCPARRVGVQGTQIIYDHGPVPPSEQCRAAMRRYHEEYDDWQRGTGGKPYRIALNSVDAWECLRHRRYSRSATEREPLQVQPKTTTTTPQFVYVGCGGQAALPCGHISDLMNPGVTLVLFSVDFWEALSRDQRYQIIKIP